MEPEIRNKDENVGCTMTFVSLTIVTTPIPKFKKKIDEDEDEDKMTCMLPEWFDPSLPSPHIDNQQSKADADAASTKLSKKKKKKEKWLLTASTSTWQNIKVSSTHYKQMSRALQHRLHQFNSESIAPECKLHRIARA